MVKSHTVFVFFSLLILIGGLFNYNFILNQYEYFIYICYLCISIVFFSKKILLPPSYLICFVAYLFIVFVNYLVTTYSPNFLYFAIGLIFSLLPFFHYILSYNYKFDDNQIINYIDIIVKIVLIIDCISILETYVFHTVVPDKRLIDTSIFWLQYLASFNNLALVLGIALFKLTRKKKYIYIVLLFALYAILTLQLKTYIGLLTIFVCYSIIYSKRNLQ